MKSLRKLLSEAQDLVAITDLTHADIVAVTVYRTRVEMHLRALALARVSRLLDVPRSRIDFHTTDNSVQITFTARGARWVALIMQEEMSDFYQALGLDPTKRLSVQPLALEHCAVGKK